MPEILTKHPGVVMDVLQSGGAECGDGLPQKILTQCPAEAFCALPGGEICVYGLSEVSAMTQISDADLAAQVCPQTAGGCAMTGEGDAAALFITLLAGFIIGRRTRGWRDTT